LHAGDMAGSDWGRFVDLLGYASARRTSAGNAKFLNSLSRQLHVPRDECLAVAEQLLGARMVCPLGGEFTLVEGRRQAARWASTVWATEDPARPVVVPAEYRAPPLSWMRGLEAEVVMAPGQLTLHAQIDMQFDDTTTPKAELIPPPPADDEESLDELPTEELPELDKPDGSDA
jgi:hypothetical protein